MKKLIFLAVAIQLPLAGCVSSPKPPSMPLYDRSAHAILADDYAIKRLYVPDNFSLVERQNSKRRMEFDFADQDKNVLTVVYPKTESESAADLLKADGYEIDQLRSGKVHYKLHRGLYSDDSSFVPDGAPACAAGATVIRLGADTEGPIVAVYLKGWSCDSIDDFGEYQQNRLKNEAYELLELK